MSVPTPAEDELTGALEDVQQSGVVHCRLCDEPVDVSDADGWDDVLEALNDHGESEHEWIDGEGWSP